MSNSALTRRAPDGSNMISFVPTTNLYAKNGVTITRYSGGVLDGKINTVTISDGFIQKVLTMVYSGTTLMGFATVLESA